MSGFLEDVDGKLIPKQPNTVAARPVVRERPYLVSAGPPDTFVVENRQLQAVLGEFTTAWSRQHPGVANRPSGRHVPDVTTLTPIDWLVRETGLPEETVRHAVKHKRGTTELRAADALLAAIGRTDALHHMTVLPHGDNETP